MYNLCFAGFACPWGQVVMWPSNGGPSRSRAIGGKWSRGLTPVGHTDEGLWRAGEGFCLRYNVVNEVAAVSCRFPDVFGFHHLLLMCFMFSTFALVH